MPDRSLPGPPPRCAATSAKASEISDSVIAASTVPSGSVASRIPRASMPLVNAAVPALPRGSRRAGGTSSRGTSCHGTRSGVAARLRVPSRRRCGGSSGGSAAAVAAGIVPLTTGTDTGGSIRLPASACGVVGMKATYGRVSRHGAAARSWSLDHVGPLTRSVRDTAASCSLDCLSARMAPRASSTLATPRAESRARVSREWREAEPHRDRDAPNESQAVHVDPPEGACHL